MKLSRQQLTITLVIAFCVLMIGGGCGITGAPRGRLGTLPTPPPGPRFAEPDKLGNHSYGFSLFEKNANVYTCLAGHVDVTHLRCNADHTRYIIKKIRKTMQKGKTEYRFNLSWERSKYIVTFTYPENWNELSAAQKTEIINEVSLDAGAYVSFNAGIWHEILTWFGVHFAGFEPEFNSAFTWEDMYSNLLGVRLAVEAVKQDKYSYNKAMTIGINNAIAELMPQSKKVAIDASKKMRGKWYKGIFAVQTFRKNIDIGLDDGMVSPVLVPGICTGTQPKPLPVPRADAVEKHGFTVKFEIHPKEWERGKIYKLLDPPANRGRVEVETHYPQIMAHIRKEAVERYGYIIEE